MNALDPTAPDGERPCFIPARAVHDAWSRYLLATDHHHAPRRDDERGEAGSVLHGGAE